VTVKHTFDYVKQSFEQDGYTLLTDSYINGDQKLQYLCKNGHKHSMIFYNWRSGYRCPTCFNDSRKLDMATIRKSLLSEGYVLLTTNYVNNKQKLDCICNKGHRCTISWALWSSGKRRCRICGYENVSLKQMGPGNHNWLGGVSYEPYCEIWQDKDYKRSILKRDGDTCQRCGITNMLSLLIHGKRLTVHHIDYDKKNCHPTNLITLCNSCNPKSNYNRDLHSRTYRDIIKVYSSKLRKEFYNKVKRVQ
jgi:hypothetical protein